MCCAGAWHLCKPQRQGGSNSQRGVARQAQDACSMWPEGLLSPTQVYNVVSVQADGGLTVCALAAGLKCTTKQCCSTSGPQAVLCRALYTLHHLLQTPTGLMQCTA